MIHRCRHGIGVATLVFFLFSLCRWPPMALALVRIPLTRPPRPLPRSPHAPFPNAHVAMMQSDQDPASRHRHYARVFSPPSHLPIQFVDDYLYAATVALGSPPQNFTVLLDTGSTDAWVPGQRCRSCGVHHRHFDRRRSQSFEDLHTPFDGVYGSGDSRGDVVRDTLRVGDHALPRFVFALITSETGDIPGFPTDGVLGLAFRGMSKIDDADRRLPTLLDALASPAWPLPPVFAFQLMTNPTADAIPLEFHLGGVDLSRVGAQPRVAYFPVLSLPHDAELMFWTVALDAFRVVDDQQDERDEPLEPLCAPFCYAIVDSGTSLIYAPSQIFDSVLARITRRQRHCDRETLTCAETSVASFPSLAFSFGNGHDARADAPNVFVLRPERYVACDDQRVCTINIRNHAEMGDDLFWWVLGDAFLQAFYTVFDAGARRIGFACDVASDDCAIQAAAAP